MGIEVVTISLTDSTGAIDPTGATVTITNTDLNVTLLSTSWQGEPIIANISTNTNYTVSVSTVDGVQPPSQSYKAGWKTARNITFDYFDVYVDLGLPSGSQWAKCNIDVTQPSGFAASEYQYEGSIFAFGNVIAKAPTDTPYFVIGEYSNQPGAALTGDIPVSATYDAARAICGFPWRMPTKADYDELLENCDYVDANNNVISTTDKRVTINNVVGVKLRSKINGNIIFFAASGYNIGNGWSDKGIRGRYRVSTLYSNDDAYEYRVDPDYYTGVGYEARRFGFFIRPII